MNDFMQFTIGGLAIGAVYSLVALGWTIVIDVSGIVNLAQGEMVMIGGLTTAYLVGEHHWPLALAMVVAILASGVVSGLLDWGVLRRIPSQRPTSLILGTIGASLLLREVARLAFGSDTLYANSLVSSSPLHLGGVSVLPQQVLLAGVLIVVAGGLAVFFRATRMGRAMQASVQSAIGARVVGINPANMRTLAFIGSGLLGGLAGVLVVPLFGMSWDSGTMLGLNGFVAAVFGGVGSYPAAVVGGLLLGLIHGYSAGYLPTAYTDVITLSLLIVLLLARPSGLSGRGRELVRA
jgi:branched-chain amino acid transport system permease protein